MTEDPNKPLTPEEQRKVKRTLLWLYVAMGVLGALPFLALWWSGRSK